MKPEPDLNPAPDFPFAGNDDATRRAIGIAVAGVENLIHQLVRRSFPKIDRADHDDLVQQIRIHLATYTARKFDATRSKWVTLAHTAIVNQCRARLRIKRRPHRHQRMTGGEVPAKSGLYDRRIESLAQAILADPRRFGMTETQADVFKAITNAQPGTQLKDIAVSLGYVRQTSLSSVLRRIKSIITSIDMDDSDAAGFPMAQPTGGPRCTHDQ